FMIYKKKIMMKINKTRTLQKEEVMERNNRLDPNNNKNLQEKPLVKKRGKKEHDDGFEHRLSKETAV
ncbi:MAG: hypothetical protein ACHQNT_05225, partial [Bacteroidia bacterium]